MTKNNILTADHIRRTTDGLGSLLSLLPELGFTTSQKQSMGAYLFQEGRQLALLVSDALRSRKETSPELRDRGTYIHNRLERAKALLYLETLLLTAARRAGELAMHDLSGAVRDSLEAVQQAEDEARRTQPGSGPRLWRLRSALALLTKKNARVARGVRQGHERRAAIARAAQL